MIVDKERSLLGFAATFRLTLEFVKRNTNVVGAHAKEGSNFDVGEAERV